MKGRRGVHPRVLAPALLPNPCEWKRPKSVYRALGQSSHQRGEREDWTCHRIRKENRWGSRPGWARWGCGRWCLAGRRPESSETPIRDPRSRAPQKHHQRNNHQRDKGPMPQTHRRPDKRVAALRAKSPPRRIRQGCQPAPRVLTSRRTAWSAALLQPKRRSRARSTRDHKHAEIFDTRKLEPFRLSDLGSDEC
eukprot:5085909-Prymnesium_polylepis.2